MLWTHVPIFVSRIRGRDEGGRLKIGSQDTFWKSVTARGDFGPYKSEISTTGPAPPLLGNNAARWYQCDIPFLFKPCFLDRKWIESMHSAPVLFWFHHKPLSMAGKNVEGFLNYSSGNSESSYLCNICGEWRRIRVWLTYTVYVLSVTQVDRHSRARDMLILFRFRQIYNPIVKTEMIRRLGKYGWMKLAPMMGETLQAM